MVLADHVYAHYKLNSFSGIVATDSSGNGRDGTLINMEDGDWVAGKLNNCLRFNEGSTNEYVTCGNIASFERTDSFSLECWIKILASPVSIAIEILTKHDAVYKGWQMQIYNNNVLINISGGGTNRIRVYGSTNVKDGAWHHIIATYDGSSTAAGVKIYVDGNIETPHVVNDNLIATIINGGNVQMSVNNINHYINGYMDEVVIYDTKLSPLEVEFRYNSGSGREDFTAAPPTLTNPDPGNGAAGVGYNKNLGWDSDGVKWDVYFGTGSPPPLVQTNHSSSDYTLFDLDSCTLYYWKIVAYNSLGGATTGAEWSFTTGNELPIMPHNNSPAHNSTGNPLSLTLSWDSGDYNPNDTVVYDIYFGEASNPPLVKTNHGSTSYNVSGLSYDKNYYWKIIARDDASCGAHETTSPIWKFTTKDESLGGYKSYDPRETIRENIGISKFRVSNSEEEYWMFEVKDKLTDDIEIPMYLAEEVKSGSIKEMPFIDMNLMQVEYAPHDIGARTRRHKCWLDIGLWYADTDNIDRHDFGKKIVDKLIDKIRSVQCGMTHIDFINVESVRLLREPSAHQVIYHYVISIYCLFYDLGESSY